MVNFHELQELFLLSHAHGILDDEELLILYEEYWPKNPDFCYENYERFSLDDMNDESTWPSSGSENTIFHFSPRSFKYQTVLLVTKEP